MAQTSRQPLVFSGLRGMIAQNVSRFAFPEGFAVSAANVTLEPHRLMVPRPGTAAFSTTGTPPSSTVGYLYEDRAGAALWAVRNLSSTPAVHRYTGGTWSSIATTDTIAACTPHFCGYNGKVFLAYDSSANRLHVYDGTGTVRRVGIGNVTAPSVANNGAGAYAATLRYYKVQMRTVQSSVTVTASELSSATSFTPSGAGATARITKPTTVDSATHWVVFASSDGVTYYNLTGNLAVGITAYDDTATPSTYATIAVNAETAPEAGLFIPPPSAKFLVTDGERLIMAGAYETSASTGETTPSSRRVWFTRPLGVTDLGDDEAITLTETSRYYLDLDTEDGSPITGLAVSVDGSILAFTATSTWRLTSTGLTDVPFRPERLSAKVGAIGQRAIATAEGRPGETAVYFVSPSGPYRWSTSSGFEWIGEDIVSKSQPDVGATRFASDCLLGWDQNARKLYFVDGILKGTWVLRPELQAQDGPTLRGGWSYDDYSWGNTTPKPIPSAFGSWYDAILYGSTVSPYVFSGTGNGTSDAGYGYDTTVTLPYVTPTGLWSRFRTEDAYLIHSGMNSLAVSLQLVADNDAYAVVASPAFPATGYLARAENTTMADLAAVAVTLTQTSARSSRIVDRLILPVFPAETS